MTTTQQQDLPRTGRYVSPAAYVFVNVVIFFAALAAVSPAAVTVAEVLGGGPISWSSTVRVVIDQPDRAWAPGAPTLAVFTEGHQEMWLYHPLAWHVVVILLCDVLAGAAIVIGLLAVSRLLSLARYGEPFVPLAVTALRRMGWAAVGFAAVELVVRTFGQWWVETSVGRGGLPFPDLDRALGAVALGVVLLVLARCWQRAEQAVEDADGLV
ncbi:DUF2975 domain-containing protein [Microlunatus sp. Y2014]|uniref:DUF2975 domain-containing protein n=1 Tax=Microlunatus sp. Y2014 TaxID=3418488 RepID=UPI003DA7049B